MARLIAQEQYRFVLLVRARSLDHAVERTQRYLQPHFDVDRRADFEKLLRERIIVGDLTAKTPEFANDSRFLQCRRVLHMAANTYFGARYDGGAANIGGARAIFDISCERLSNRLERYVHCSTSWVTGVPSCGIFDDNNNNNNSNRISNDEESSTNKVDSPTLIDESFVNCEKTIINKNNSGFYLFNFLKEI